MQPIPSIRPSLRVLQSNPNAQGLKLRGKPVLDLIERQPQFRVVGEGSPSTRAIVPATRAGAKLLAGPSGKRFEQILRGTLSALDGREGVDIQGIALSTGRDGLAASGLMSVIDGGWVEIADRRTAGSTAVLHDALKGERKVAGARLGVYYPGSGWVALAPGISRQLVRAAEGNSDRSVATQYAQYVLAHELEHSTTVEASSNPRVDWIDEGTAEVMSLQQRSADQRADAANLPRHPISAERRNAWLSSYSPYYHNLVNLLRFGGVEPGHKLGFERTAEILQGGATSRVAGKLARQILAEHKVSERHYEPVREAILNLGDDRHANTVRELVRDLKAKDGSSVST